MCATVLSSRQPQRSRRWPRLRLRPRAPLAVIAAVLVSGCALTGPKEGDLLVFEQPETQVDYEVALTGAPSPEIGSLLEASLAVYRRQSDGAQSLAFLRRRAEADLPTVRKILRSYGYYEADALIDVSAAGGAEDGSPPQAVVTIAVDPGRAYTLGSHEIVTTDAGETPVPPLDARSLGSPVGEEAVARRILDAETAAVTQLREGGRPYAERQGRDAAADPETAEIAVVTTIAAGRRYVFGETVFSGLETVEADYLETYRPWTAGETFNQAQIVAYQRALAGTGLFEAATVRAPETPPAGDAAPVEAVLVEAPHRTVSGGLRYDTDIGPAARGTFEHRNVFGANETLGLIAEIGLEEQRFETTYRIPQFNRPGQDFTSSLEVRRVEDEAFDEIGVTGAAGLEREIGAHWVAGIGGLAEISVTEDEDSDGAAYLLGVPAFRPVRQRRRPAEPDQRISGADLGDAVSGRLRRRGGELLQSRRGRRDLCRSDRNGALHPRRSGPPGLDPRRRRRRRAAAASALCGRGRLGAWFQGAFRRTARRGWRSRRRSVCGGAGRRTARAGDRADRVRRLFRRRRSVGGSRAGLR